MSSIEVVGEIPQEECAELEAAAKALAEAAGRLAAKYPSEGAAPGSEVACHALQALITAVQVDGQNGHFQGFATAIGTDGDLFHAIVETMRDAVTATLDVQKIPEGETAQ